ncbi:MAG: small ribosomal subunit biogenesis GTPase RsgA [Gammaproteobacteria bacterium]|nr:small ribosomal subunit biogenesis GTPase RsgA [Gammaproteobacteria bacterium]
MSKRRLTHKQLRQTKQNQRKRVEHASKSSTHSTQSETLGPAQFGIVTSNFGQNLVVQDEQHHSHRCNVRQNLGSVVCGDEVVWHQLATEEGIVTAIRPRRSLLERPVHRGDAKPVAANIDQVLIVTAPVPSLQKTLIDRYLVASEIAGINAVILVNKIDLLSAKELDALKGQIETYQDLGYSVLYFSAKSGVGSKELVQILKSKNSVLAGQSGVGKSSTIKFLLPDQEIQIGELADRLNLGKHTTTTSQLFHLEHGGAIIDSPGVRDFGLWQYPKEKILWGFKEFRDVLGMCKYRNCTHHHEPGCKLREKAESGELSAERYQSLLKILTQVNL